MTAITAITAQNTVGVEAVEPVSPRMIVAQVRAVAEDIGVDAVKIGMLGTTETVEAVVEALAYVGDAPVVIDPVMVAESGAELLDDERKDGAGEQAPALATVVTPNIPEARVLSGMGEEANQARLAWALVELGAQTAVVTGGHSDEVVDVFYDGRDVAEIPGERHPDGAAHGSGCTHSSALAAYLALGHSPLEAAERARAVASEAVRDGLREHRLRARPRRRLRPDGLSGDILRPQSVE